MLLLFLLWLPFLLFHQQTAGLLKLTNEDVLEKLRGLITDSSDEVKRLALQGEWLKSLKKKTKENIYTLHENASKLMKTRVDRVIPEQVFFPFSSELALQYIHFTLCVIYVVLFTFCLVSDVCLCQKWKEN